MLRAGDKAPGFTLRDGGEEEVSLSDFSGKKVVLYFYPKDDTPGCTTEAMDFSRARDQFAQNNTIVIGISKDSCASHAKFSDKHNLDVVLLSDPDHQVQEAYGVWQEKSMMGKKYMGTLRTTFLINEDGIIEKIWENVKVPGHVEEVLGATA